MARELCECGNADYEFAVQRIGLERRTYCRCRCGREWTEVAAADALAEAISSSEIIDVHALLESDKTLGELLS